MPMCDAKTLLQQVKLYDAHINNKLEEAARIRALATKITSTLKPDVVSGSGEQDKIGDAIARIIDLEREANAIIDAYVNLKKYVDEIIEKVPDPEEYNVLKKRYFLYERWEQIALEMNMSHRNVTRLHGRALQTVNELLKKEKLSLNVLECPN